MTILIGLSRVSATVFDIVQLLFAFLAAFFFLALEVGHLFVGHLVVLAGREHRSAAAVAREIGIAAAPFAGTEAADTANRFGDGSGFDQKFADLLEEIVEMVWLERVGKTFAFKNWLKIRRTGDRHEIERANAFRRLLRFQRRGDGLGFGELLEYGEERPARVGQRDIDDHEAPGAGRQLRQRLGYELNDAHTPALGIEDVFQRVLAGRIIVNDQDSNVFHGWVSTGVESPVYRLRYRAT